MLQQSPVSSLPVAGDHHSDLRECRLYIGYRSSSFLHYGITRIAQISCSQCADEAAAEEDALPGEIHHDIVGRMAGARIVQLHLAPVRPDRLFPAEPLLWDHLPLFPAKVLGLFSRNRARAQAVQIRQAGQAVIVKMTGNGHSFKPN